MQLWVVTLVGLCNTISEVVVDRLHGAFTKPVCIWKLAMKHGLPGTYEVKSVTYCFYLINCGCYDRFNNEAVPLDMSGLIPLITALAGG